MSRELTYDDVVELLVQSESDCFIQQITTLLILVHETMNEKSLHKSDFVFTQYNEGHILVSNVADGA